jgi:hypothetical protein
MASNFNVTGFWSAVGVIFFLVAMYLVLNNGSSATGILGALFKGGGSLVSTLQGR